MPFKDPQKERVYKQEWRLKNLEKLKEQAWKWRRSFKARFAALKYGAQIRKFEVSLTFEQFKVLRSFPCFYCRGDLSETCGGIDRIDSTIGYTLENCRPCCTDCNIAKSNMTEVEFKNWILKVYNSWVKT